MLPNRTVVTLLTQEDCGFCHDAEEILARLSTPYGFEVVKLDLETPQGRELATKAGVLFPPGLLIDGEPFSYGRLSERRLRRKLDARRDPLRST